MLFWYYMLLLFLKKTSSFLFPAYVHHMLDIIVYHNSSACKSPTSLILGSWSQHNSHIPPILLSIGHLLHNIPCKMRLFQTLCSALRVILTWKLEPLCVTGRLCLCLQYSPFLLITCIRCCHHGILLILASVIFSTTLCLMFVTSTQIFNLYILDIALR